MRSVKVNAEAPLATSIHLKVTRLIASAQIPEKVYPTDAGFDVFAQEHIEIPPFGRAKIRTGIKLELPDQMYAMILPRSGLAVQHGVTVLNAPGLIDPGYKGEIRVVLYNTDATHPFRVKIGNRIAQLVFLYRTPIVLRDVPWAECTLDEMERGEKGFGSSGL